LEGRETKRRKWACTLNKPENDSLGKSPGARRKVGADSRVDFPLSAQPGSERDEQVYLSHRGFRHRHHQRSFKLADTGGQKKHASYPSWRPFPKIPKLGIV
jgi:hypothetical protein